GRADQPGQPLRAAAAGNQAERDLRLAELSALPRYPEVGAQRQLKPAAEGVPGDGRDHRLADPGHRGERALKMLDVAGHRGVAAVGHLLDVRPGREYLLAAIQDDRPDLR